jgi:TM2 domain-containing membrane protein YozV
MSDDANNTFDDFLSDQPMPDESALLNLARDLELDDREDEALDIVQRVLRTNPNNVDGLVMFGQLSHDTQRAISALNKALQLQPDNTEAKRQLKRLDRSGMQKVDQVVGSDAALQQLVQQNQQMMQQMQRQPVINIINENSNQQVHSSGPVYGSPMYAQTPVRAAKSKTTAAILAIFFGSFGVHHFYLGKTGLGILYLLFFWAYIPGLVGFIEGIVMLATSDEDWMRKYPLFY